MQSDVQGNVRNWLITDRWYLMKFSVFKTKIIPNQGRIRDPARQSGSGFHHGNGSAKLAVLHLARVWFIANPAKLSHRTGHLEYRQIHGNHKTANCYP